VVSVELAIEDADILPDATASVVGIGRNSALAEELAVLHGKSIHHNDQSRARMEILVPDKPRAAIGVAYPGFRDDDGRADVVEDPARGDAGGSLVDVLPVPDLLCTDLERAGGGENEDYEKRGYGNPEPYRRDTAASGFLHDEIVYNATGRIAGEPSHPSDADFLALPASVAL
jgi:hypothetical protein